MQRDFGTGALKVTPSHDRDDYEIGIRHNLERVKVMDERGLLVKIDDYEHAVGKCYRCATVIEPTTSKQWFVSVRPLADKAGTAVE